jgi:hypothetical protein
MFAAVACPWSERHPSGHGSNISFELRKRIYLHESRNDQYRRRTFCVSTLARLAAWCERG